MKIYFAGSIRGGRKNQGFYMRLIEYLGKYGNVLTRHVGDSGITEWGEDGMSDADIHNRDLSWLQEADIVIAEVSAPSLGVGYELAKAEEMKKRVLCLYRPQEVKRLSAMIAGSPKLVIKPYESVEDAIRYIDEFFAKP